MAIALLEVGVGEVEFGSVLCMDQIPDMYHTVHKYGIYLCTDESE